MPNDAHQTRIGEIHEVCGDGACTGTCHCNAIVVVDYDVPKLVNLFRARLYGRNEARVHDDRAVTCRSQSLPLGPIHVLHRIIYPIAVSHRRGPAKVGSAGTHAMTESHVNTRLQVLGGGGTSSGHVTSATMCTGGDGRNKFATKAEVGIIEHRSASAIWKFRSRRWLQIWPSSPTRCE